MKPYAKIQNTAAVIGPVHAYLYQPFLLRPQSANTSFSPLMHSAQHQSIEFAAPLLLTNALALSSSEVALELTSAWPFT